MQAVEERVCDQAVLKLLGAMLRAGVMSDGASRREGTGTPQGGPISPLLCNVYLHRIDRAWDVREHGVLVRFADDAVVMCRSRQQAEAALARLTALLAELGLEPKAAKTRIVHLIEGGEGLDFLGFHHRWVRAEGRTGGKGVAFLARWPADRAMQHARDRIRQLTDRRRMLLRVESIVEDVNQFFRGWAGYFRYGNSALRFEKIRSYLDQCQVHLFIRYADGLHGGEDVVGDIERWVGEQAAHDAILAVSGDQDEGGVEVGQHRLGLLTGFESAGHVGGVALVPGPQSDPQAGSGSALGHRLA
jgi:group II intron reverse transcriptase/maturase